MTRDSRRRSSSDEADLFGPPAQGSLFADAPQQPARYVPKPEHVRSALRDYVAKLQGERTWWRWNDWQIERYRTREVEYFCNLIPDPAEAAEWRARLGAEIARLDAASGTERPAEEGYYHPKRAAPGG